MIYYYLKKNNELNKIEKKNISAFGTVFDSSL